MDYKKVEENWEENAANWTRLNEYDCRIIPYFFNIRGRKCELTEVFLYLCVVIERLWNLRLGYQLKKSNLSQI